MLIGLIFPFTLIFQIIAQDIQTTPTSVIIKMSTQQILINGYLQIHLPYSLAYMNYNFYSIKGELIQSGQLTIVKEQYYSFDINSLQIGQYLIQVMDNGCRITEKYDKVLKFVENAMIQHSLDQVGLQITWEQIIYDKINILDSLSYEFQSKLNFPYAILDFQISTKKFKPIGEYLTISVEGILTIEFQDITITNKKIDNGQGVQLIIEDQQRCTTNSRIEQAQISYYESPLKNEVSCNTFQGFVECNMDELSLMSKIKMQLNFDLVMQYAPDFNLQIRAYSRRIINKRTGHPPSTNRIGAILLGSFVQQNFVREMWDQYQVRQVSALGLFDAELYTEIPIYIQQQQRIYYPISLSYRQNLPITQLTNPIASSIKLKLSVFAQGIIRISHNFQPLNKLVTCTYTFPNLICENIVSLSNEINISFRAMFIESPTSSDFLKMELIYLYDSQTYTIGTVINTYPSSLFRQIKYNTQVENTKFKNINILILEDDQSQPSNLLIESEFQQSQFSLYNTISLYRINMQSYEFKINLQPFALDKHYIGQSHNTSTQQIYQLSFELSFFMQNYNTILISWSRRFLDSSWQDLCEETLFAKLVRVDGSLMDYQLPNHDKVIKKQYTKYQLTCGLIQWSDGISQEDAKLCYELFQTQQLYVSIRDQQSSVQVGDVPVKDYIIDYVLQLELAELEFTYINSVWALAYIPQFRTVQQYNENQIALKNNQDTNEFLDAVNVKQRLNDVKFEINTNTLHNNEIIRIFGDFQLQQNCLDCNFPCLQTENTKFYCRIHQEASMAQNGANGFFKSYVDVIQNEEALDFQNNIIIGFVLPLQYFHSNFILTVGREEGGVYYPAKILQIISVAEQIDLIQGYSLKDVQQQIQTVSTLQMVQQYQSNSSIAIQSPQLGFIEVIQGLKVSIVKKDRIQGMFDDLDFNFTFEKINKKIGFCFLLFKMEQISLNQEVNPSCFLRFQTIFLWVECFLIEEGILRIDLPRKTSSNFTLRITNVKNTIYLTQMADLVIDILLTKRPYVVNPSYAFTYRIVKRVQTKQNLIFEAHQIYNLYYSQNNQSSLSYQNQTLSVIALDNATLITDSCSFNFWQTDQSIQFKTQLNLGNIRSQSNSLQLLNPFIFSPIGMIHHNYAFNGTKFDCYFEDSCNSLITNSYMMNHVIQLQIVDLYDLDQTQIYRGYYHKRIILKVDEQSFDPTKIFDVKILQLGSTRNESLEFLQTEAGFQQYNFLVGSRYNTSIQQDYIVRYAFLVYNTHLSPSFQLNVGLKKFKVNILQPNNTSLQFGTQGNQIFLRMENSKSIDKSILILEISIFNNVSSEFNITLKGDDYSQEVSIYQDGSQFQQTLLQKIQIIPWDGYQSVPYFILHVANTTEQPPNSIIGQIQVNIHLQVHDFIEIADQIFTFNVVTHDKNEKYDNEGQSLSTMKIDDVFTSAQVIFNSKKVPIQYYYIIVKKDQADDNILVPELRTLVTSGIMEPNLVVQKNNFSLFITGTYQCPLGSSSTTITNLIPAQDYIVYWIGISISLWGSFDQISQSQNGSKHFFYLDAVDAQNAIIISNFSSALLEGVACKLRDDLFLDTDQVGSMDGRGCNNRRMLSEAQNGSNLVLIQPNISNLRNKYVQDQWNNRMSQITPTYLQNLIGSNYSYEVQSSAIQSSRQIGVIQFIQTWVNGSIGNVAIVSHQPCIVYIGLHVYNATEALKVDYFTSNANQNFFIKKYMMLLEPKIVKVLEFKIEKQAEYYISYIVKQVDFTANSITTLSKTQRITFPITQGYVMDLHYILMICVSILIVVVLILLYRKYRINKSKVAPQQQDQIYQASPVNENDQGESPIGINQNENNKHFNAKMLANTDESDLRTIKNKFQIKKYLEEKGINLSQSIGEIDEIEKL